MIKMKQRTPIVRTIMLSFYTFGFFVVGATIPCNNNKIVCYSIKGLLFGMASVLIYVLIWQIFNKRFINVKGNKIIISNNIISKITKVEQPIKLEIKSFSKEIQHETSFIKIYKLLINRLVRLILFKNIYHSVRLIKNGKSKTLMQDLTEQDANRVINFLKGER